MANIYNVAREGNLSRVENPDLDEAEAIIRKYADPATGEARQAIDLDRLIEAKCSDWGMNPSDPEDLNSVRIDVQSLLKERCVDPRYRGNFERVVLDFTGDSDEPEWMNFEVPSIAFGWLPSSDGLTDTDVIGDDGTVVGKCRAIAVLFDPSLVRARHDRSKRTGEWYSKPDVYDPEGYVQIVRTFVSRDHALVAQQELARAVHVYREASKVEAPTADEPDTLDEIAENFDAGEAKKIKGRDRKSL
jgi:hypothetical protein